MLKRTYHKPEDLAGYIEQGNFKALLGKTFGPARQWLGHKGERVGLP